MRWSVAYSVDETCVLPVLLNDDQENPTFNGESINKTWPRWFHEEEKPVTLPLFILTGPI